MANWLDKYDVGGAVAKTDATRVTKPAPQKLMTEEQKKRAIRRAQAQRAHDAKELAKKVAKNQTYLSADNTTPEQRAAARTRVREENFINNAPLTQSLAAMSPNDNPMIGRLAAQTITEANPIMSAVRLTNSLKDPANNPYGIGADAGVLGNTLGVIGAAADLTDFGNMFGPAAKMAGSYLDKAIYPTRTYRASVPGGNPAIYEGSDLANKVFSKGDWTTKNLEDTFQYLRGIEVEGGRPGLITGQNMNLTEYKVPFWKKSVAADKDVIALKALQGDVPNPNEYIIPSNSFLYPRRTNLIPAVPENVKNATFTTVYGEQVPHYSPTSIPLHASSSAFSSPAYKYIEDQLNAVTGHEAPFTHTIEQARTGQLPWYNWQQPQIAPNVGIGEFKRFENGGWLEKYNDGGPIQPNYNDYSVSAGPGFQGDGYSNVGRNYSPAWGGQFKNGGSLSMPTIKDKGSFNSDGVWIPDWKAMAAQAKKLGAKKVKTDRGGVINFNDKWEAVSADDSNNMAMGGSLPGATGSMYARYSGGGSMPGDADYNAPRTGQIPNNGKYAKKTKASAQNGTEMRYYQEGLDFKPKTISRDGSQLVKLDQLTNFTNYNTKQPGGWLDKYES